MPTAAALVQSPRPRRAQTFDQSSILQEALRRIRGGRGLVVFDLDSTLLDNRPRQARIVRELGESLGDARLERCTTEQWDGWDIAAALSRCGLDADEVRQLTGPARAFWRERFFTSDYCADDVPIPGAPEFLSTVLATGILICYVTGRHEEMRAGTLSSFRAGGLALPDERRIRLMMKPRFETHDDVWKRDVATALSALGGPVVAFDNEPTHVNGYQLDFPECYAVHMDTDHSGRPVEVLPQIPSIRDFRLEPESA